MDHGGAAAWIGLAGRWPTELARDEGAIVAELMDSVAGVCWLLRQPARSVEVAFDLDLLGRAFEQFPAAVLWSKALEYRGELDSIEPALSLALADVLRVPLVTLNASLGGRPNVIVAR